MTTNAKRQAAYKQRMRDAGYQQVTVWIQPSRRHILAAFACALRGVKDPKPLFDKAWESLVAWADE